jgi:hypothetical protein
MAPTQVREPFHHDGWVYEEKVDGWRIVATQGRRPRPLGQPERPRPHPPLSRDRGGDRQAVGARALVLDGEVAIDQQLRSRFRLVSSTALTLSVRTR